jgi:hypothetical protein
VVREWGIGDERGRWGRGGGGGGVRIGRCDREVGTGVRGYSRCEIQFYYFEVARFALLDLLIPFRVLRIAMVQS